MPGERGRHRLRPQGDQPPGTPVSIPVLTPKDIEDLKFGLEHEVDYVALSFVRNADDIRLIKRYAPTTPVIAKLEKPQAVDRIDEIAQLADAVMIARGDLGVEMPLERVPLIQKTAIERTNYYGKIAIVATQMLESMIVSPQPTRAEVSDVANAVLDGADSVMLSAETATGAYPVEAVKTMASIVEEVERSARYQALPDPTLSRGESTFATAVARACAAAAQQLGHRHHLRLHPHRRDGPADRRATGRRRASSPSPPATRRTSGCRSIGAWPRAGCASRSRPPTR